MCASFPKSLKNYPTCSKVLFHPYFVLLMQLPKRNMHRSDDEIQNENGKQKKRGSLIVHKYKFGGKYVMKLPLDASTGN